MTTDTHMLSLTQQRILTAVREMVDYNVPPTIAAIAAHTNTYGLGLVELVDAMAELLEQGFLVRVCGEYRLVVP